LNTAEILPHINALLNVSALTLLVAARVNVARHRIEAHRRLMLAALAVSAVFLVSYLVYHFTAPINVFRGEGLVRPIYYVLLVSHVSLAGLVLPAILITAILGGLRRIRKHRRWARWTWPLWVYVSFSGVTVYLMLHHVFP
jgi:putative membrane protein